MKFKVVLEPSDEGGYTVYVPSLPGCISEGDAVGSGVGDAECLSLASCFWRKVEKRSNMNHGVRPPFY